MFQNILRRIRRIRQDNAIILMYHQVCHRRCDPWELAVHPNHFYDQLHFLKDNFNVVPVAELARQPSSARGKRCVAITFDDGFKDNYTHAAPLLEWHELPATFYVPTAAVQHEEAYWWDTLQEIIFHSEVLPASLDLQVGDSRLRFTFKFDRVLNSKVMNQIRSWNYHLPVPNERVALYMQLWTFIKPMPYVRQCKVLEQVREWARYRRDAPAEGTTMSLREIQNLASSPLFSVGAHSVHHAMLACQTAEEQAFEVAESKRLVEQWLNRPVEGFAYPYGSFDEVTKALLRQSGFVHGVSTENRAVSPEDDPFALPRIQVKNWCVYEFGSKLNEFLNV